MDDLIKRSDVMEVLHRIFDACPLDSDKWVIQDIRSKIADIPSADRPQWIPCSERVPIEYRTVLVTWEYAGKLYTTTAFRETSKAVTYWKSNDQLKYSPLNVIAWMPLPKPWKGADDE